MVIVHAVVAIKPEGRERWSELLKALLPAARAEDACNSYIVYESVETPNTFIFVEEWVSLEGLETHFHTSHFAAFLGGLGDILTGAPSGTVSEVSSTRTLEQAMAAAGVG